MNSGVFPGGQSSGSSSQPMNQWSQDTMRKIGPCFRCAAWGHLQKNCPKVAMYPFNWVDSSVEMQGGVVSEQTQLLFWQTPQQGACSQTMLKGGEFFELPINRIW